MQYPLISEYLAAIREAKDNLDTLSHLVPMLDKYGEPYRSSGAFAVVFKMKDEQTGKYYALKCFTEEQEGRAEAYRQIAEEFEFVDSSYITSVKYLEKELFVDSNCENEEFPVLLMDWIEGETMETYVAANYTDTHAMAMLCYRFCKMAAWLRSQSFAHGDIKPDNIMVRPDGTLTLVDYDGMFVPAMKGQKSPTIGTKDFSHPLRTIDDFDETIDDFALASIALSLKAISLNPSLLQTYGASDRLLFSAADYLDLSKSKTFTALQGLLADEEAITIMSMFLLARAKKNLSMCSFRLFDVQKPKEEEVQKSKGKEVQNPNEEDVWSTEVTDDDWRNAVEDAFGVKYSKDWKILLGAPTRLKGEYSIIEGVNVIADNAFSECEHLTYIDIPDSVTCIGDRAFEYCYSLTNIDIPDSITSIGDYTFKCCKSLTSVNVSKNMKTIGDSVFSDCKSLININIPNGVTNIGRKAFSNCDSLTDINIPNSVTNIGSYAFWSCDSLTNINIPNSVTNIKEWTFAHCKSLTNVNIPNCVTTIGEAAFCRCTSLTSINIPNNVTTVEEGVFNGCKSLTCIYIPDSVTTIYSGAFGNCNNIPSKIKSDIIKRFGKEVFESWPLLIPSAESAKTR